VTTERTGASVRIDQVAKFHGRGEEAVHALDALSLEVAPSEFVSLLGPSGCGKTTLLMIVAGLYSATTGTVTVDGKLVRKPLTDVGVVFQNPALLDWRTSLGNVLLQAEARGSDMVEARRKALDMLRLVGLGGFEKRRPYELSGGMQQRVAVCRALIHEPPLLLMDEPFGALDAITRSQLGLDLQRMLMDRPATVLFVTHSLAEAIHLSDRVVVMTGRPGSVEAVVDVDLPRPRHGNIHKEPRFQEYVAQIEEIFLKRGVLRE
jgi:NitT/TauT family transport system ATP-binding protein